MAFTKHDRVHKIHLRTADNHSPILIGQGLLSRLGAECRKAIRGGHIAIITDKTVARLFLKACAASLQKAGFQVYSIVIPGGEATKNVATAWRLWGDLIRAGLHRDDGVVALGGGVVGDIAGFVAATYMRGIAVIQVPTTLVAQVDSSIGGKTGVDHPLGKNMIGAFHQPKKILIDPEVLSTLPPREVRNGLAEVIKYGVIGDAKFFQFLEQNYGMLKRGQVRPEDSAVWNRIIRTSAAMKAHVVAQDEKEGGLRRILNYGHTFGHALETAGNYKRYLHGEAISIGMVAAAQMAVRVHLLHPAEAQRIERLLKDVGLPVRFKGVSTASVLKYLGNDKKVKAGKLHFVLPYRIGSVVVRKDVPMRVVKQSLEYVARG